MALGAFGIEVYDQFLESRQGIASSRAIGKQFFHDFTGALLAAVTTLGLGKNNSCGDALLEMVFCQGLVGTHADFIGEHLVRRTRREHGSH